MDVGIFFIKNICRKLEFNDMIKGNFLCHNNHIFLQF